MGTSNSLLISGSWDRTVSFWDINSGQRAGQSALPAKVFCSALRGNVLIVGLSNKNVAVFDLRKPQTPISCEATVLKHQLRALAVFPDSKGFAVASVEGRTAIKHFNKFDASRDFSFKCHRHQRGHDKNRQNVFAVN